MEHFEPKEQPREVVLEYRQPDYREVVERYSCPLPKRRQVQGKAPAVPQKKKRRRAGLWIFLGCLAALVVLIGIGIAVDAVQVRWEVSRGEPPYGFDFEMDEYLPEPGWEETEILLPTAEAGQGVELEVHKNHGDALTPQELYRQVNPAVVSVILEMEDGLGMGTGVIFREDGYIVTNYHVVAGGTACQVMLESGYSYEAKYIGGDRQRDLAILKIDQTGLAAAEFGDSDRLVVGDPVYAIGNPLGFELRGTLTDGIVSAVDRTMEMDSGASLDLIQTNAALNEGNSGGPLINQYGQVVGINVIKMRMRSSDVSVEGLGFAIPSAEMERLINDILTYGELQPEPVLGLMVMNLGEQLTEDLWGAEVDGVTAGGAADRAGVRKGDFIIAVGDVEPVLGSKDVLRARQAYHVGEQMPMKLWRDGEIIEVILDLQEAADEK